MKRKPTNPRRRNRETPSASADAPSSTIARRVVDAVAEIVHRGYGRLLDATELRIALEGWRPNSSMNYEYVFAWNPETSGKKRPRRTAEERLDAGTGCQWVDLSFITDSKRRRVFVIEMGNAAVGDNDDVDSIIDRLDDIWRWKSQPLTIAGPFASSDEAEAWMSQNGAFKEAG